MDCFLVLVLTVTCMVTHASALSCYQCQYTDGEAESVANQKNCADTFNSQNIATATTVSGKNCVSCGAIKSTYKGKVTTIRTCVPDGMPGALAGCKTDNCNNGAAREYLASPLPAPATDLSCYQCSYDGDTAEHAFNQKNCADPFQSDGINKVVAIMGMACVTCTSGKSVVNGKNVTSRACLANDNPTDIGGLETCKTNNCNDGTAPLFTIPPLPGTGPTVETVNGSTGLTVPTISESTGPTGATVNGGTGPTGATVNGGTVPTEATTVGSGGNAKATGVTALVLGALFVCL
ncbi:hypothetical protein BV898_16587 [Hypsibius exemplaris]|uniref:UPAR/Ly6 domain-containing protein n=1 Tax=Hypsibius exemplaris TaxID=2072580 RepID=A0A9X6NG54_HYPEX|nr:hypothetical protein BV898_16587 [Hypsibius exemplaris]